MRYSTLCKICLFWSRFYFPPPVTHVHLLKDCNNGNNFPPDTRHAFWPYASSQREQNSLNIFLKELKVLLIIIGTLWGRNVQFLVNQSHQLLFCFVCLFAFFFLNTKNSQGVSVLKQGQKSPGLGPQGLWF